MAFAVCVGLPDDRTTRTRSYILSDQVGREHDEAGEADRIQNGWDEIYWKKSGVHA